MSIALIAGFILAYPMNWCSSPTASRHGMVTVRPANQCVRQGPLTPEGFDTAVRRFKKAIIERALAPATDNRCVDRSAQAAELSETLSCRWLSAGDLAAIS